MATGDFIYDGGAGAYTKATGSLWVGSSYEQAFSGVYQPGAASAPHPKMTFFDGNSEASLELLTVPGGSVSVGIEAKTGGTLYYQAQNANCILTRGYADTRYIANIDKAGTILSTASEVSAIGSANPTDCAVVGWVEFDTPQNYADILGAYHYNGTNFRTATVGLVKETKAGEFDAKCTLLGNDEYGLRVNYSGLVSLRGSLPLQEIQLENNGSLSLRVPASGDITAHLLSSPFPAVSDASILTRAYADTRYLTTSTAASTYTPQVRTISAGTGLSGGGDLSANRTLSLAASGVAAGQYGSGSVIPKITIDTYGRITAVQSDTVYPDWNNISSKPTTFAYTTANTFSAAQNLADNELIRAKLKDYSETRATPAISAGSLTLNLETANFFAVSLNANVSNAIVISNPPASGSVGSLTLELTADGTARTINWGAIKWPSGTPPTLTSASGKRDILVFYTTDGGTNWYGLVGGQNL